MWLYDISPRLVLVAAFAALFAVSYLGYRVGARWTNRDPEGNPRYLSDVVPSTILGLLALILGFSFSMAVIRFENRRQLVVDEANAIGTTYLRTGTLRPPHGERIAELLRVYVDRRIEFYDALPDVARRKKVEAQVVGLQRQIWVEAEKVTVEDRGAIESIFLNSLNSMIDLENERTIALTKTLPPMIYWTILFIAACGMASFNFTRAQKKEAGQWQPAILILMVSFILYFLVDLERPVEGRIRISQDALVALRESLR